MNLQSLDDWLVHIESFNPKEIELGLSRIKQVAERLDCLSLSSKTVLIAGTNGKGSCVAMLESVALQQNKTVACYTSPHLLKFNERIRLNGQSVSDESLIEAFQAIEAKREEITLTFFEFTTLAALLIFQQSQPELVVLEVGLGGRLDATNIIEPDVSVITTVAMDHTDWLGDTLEKIAYEKGGVIRKDKPALIGDKKTFSLINKVLPDFSRKILLAEDKTETLSQVVNNAKINRYQLVSQNLLLAKLAFEQCFDQEITTETFSEALSNISLSGRFQSVKGLVMPTIVDVAHNPQSAKNLYSQLENYIKAHSITKVKAIFGVMADKSVSEVIEIIDPLINHWCFVDLDIPRAMTSQAIENLHKNLALSSKTACFDGVSSAYLSLSKETSPNQLLIVFGSFITVANMLQYASDSL
jgi:dihydrofolate synthase/folylpolyglutamate synthase